MTLEQDPRFYFDARERPEKFQIRLTRDLSLCGYRSGENSYDLVLAHLTPGSGDVFNLGTLVPKHQFASDRQFAVDPAIHTINFDYQELQYAPKSILFLFHEIGHAKIFEDTGVLKWPYLLALGRASKKRFDSEKHSKRILREERNAWAVGLRLARRCRDMGFDIFEMFDDKDAVITLMREDSLETYEATLRRLVGEDEMRKFSRTHRR